MLKHSAPFISPEGHERSSGQHESLERLAQSAALGLCWVAVLMEAQREPGSPRAAISMHTQGSAGSDTFSTMMKTH